MRRNHFIAITLCAALLGALTACKPKAEPRTRPLVVASFYPLYDFARTLAGTNYEVQCLVPAGEDPHGIEASPAAAKLVADADLVLTLGLGFDTWVERLAKSDKNTKLVSLNDGIQTRKPSAVLLQEFAEKGDAHDHSGHAHGHDHDHAETEIDPHVWLDPIAAKELVRHIARELISLAPTNQTVVQQRTDALLADLDALDKDFAAAVAGFRTKDVVTFHSAFSYLFARYGLNERAVIQLFPGDEPSAAYLRKLVDLSRKTGVKTVFAEPDVQDRAAQIIAREIGGSVERLDPMERILAEAPERGYVARQRENLGTLQRVLGAKP
jgi:zinc transport system substrate-binding protein